MITFSPYSVPVSRPRFGQQNQESVPVHIFMPIYELNYSQKKILADLQRTGLITEAKIVEKHPQLVRLTLRPDQSPEKFAKILRDEYIGAIIEDDPAFGHFENLAATKDYAFAT